MPAYCYCWSGGKDSTAQIILAHEKKEPVDYIIFSEVMFDKNGFSGEDPDHIRFIYDTAKPMFESWGYKVMILRSPLDYLDIFYHKISRGPNKGKPHGFPLSGMCAIKRDCKLKPMQEFLNNLDEEYMEVVGIAIDEPKRLASLHKKPHKMSLLEKYGYTEQMARKLCEKYGLLSPIYGLNGGAQRRGGCWFCPNAKCEEHKKLRQEHPEIWQKFISLEDTPNLDYEKWNCYKEKGELHRREEQFRREEQHGCEYIQLSLFDLSDELFKTA